MEITLEQHLGNVQVAVLNATGKYEDLVAIRESFNHISKLLLAPKEGEKEEKP